MRRPSAHSLLACSLAASTLSCNAPPPQISFTVAARMDAATKSCTSNTVTSLNPAAVRISVRMRDASNQVVMAGGKPVVCDGLVDPTKGTVFELPQEMLGAGAKADLFVEAFDDKKQRIASGAVLGWSPVGAAGATVTPPKVRLLPAEKWSCLPGSTDATKALRLLQQRAFHSATRLPNGEVFYAYGLTTAASGDAPSMGEPESTQKYFATTAMEVYDPVTQSFVAVKDGGTPVARAFHHAVLLDGPAEGPYRILIVGGLAAVSAGKPFLGGASATFANKVPTYFRFSVAADNTGVAPSEILTYDPASRTVTRASADALRAQDAALQAGAPVASPSGILTAGGLALGPQPAATANAALTVDPAKPLLGKLAAARAGASLAAITDANGRPTGALLVGGITDANGFPDPFERIDLMTAKGAALKATGAIPAYLFPTLTALDAGAAMPRVLVSGGLEVTASGQALEPPASMPTMQLVKYAGAGTTLEVTADAAFTGLTLQSVCGKGDVKRVAWNAATLLASSDGVLAGDRVLLSGGTPHTDCMECGDRSHTCAVSQVNIVGVVPAPNKLPIAAGDKLQVARFGHTQTLLRDHTVLVAGGLTHAGATTTGAVEAELWNSARAVPPTGDTGDADDPLLAELRLAGLKRNPGEVAGGATPTIACKQPTR